jgi:hypothetical protein
MNDYGQVKIEANLSIVLFSLVSFIEEEEEDKNDE